MATSRTTQAVPIRGIPVLIKCQCHSQTKASDENVFISEFYCSLNSLKYISSSIVVPSGGKNRRVDGKQINTNKFYSNNKKVN